MAVLQDLSQAELIEIIMRQRQNGHAKLTLKVSEKGALSVCGLQKWPVTLYAGQWERVLADADRIKQFIKDNADTLARKGED